MKRKTRKSRSRRGAARLISFLTAAFVLLGALALLGFLKLEDYRRQTAVDAERAFAETVDALDAFSRSLQKSLYAADGAMCAKVCAESYADAQRAGTALSALPFSTVEMMELKRFLGLAGDYAYTLCREAAEQGFQDEQREKLVELSQTAAALAEAMEGMQQDLADGTIEMDRRERQIANVLDEAPRFLSEQLGSYAQGFSGVDAPVYPGRYSAREEKDAQPVDETRAREQAAQLLGCAPEELEITASYEDQGCLLLTRGSQTLTVTAAGVEALRDERLVSERNISEEQARAAAEKALTAIGVRRLRLERSEERGELLDLRYSAETAGVTPLERAISVSVALDDGSLYALSFANAGEKLAPERWAQDEETLRQRLPEGLKLQELRRVSIAGADGRSIPCYELRCLSDQQQEVRIYLHAESLRQEEIEIE